MKSKVERFIHGKDYRFIVDYLYSDYKGDVQFKVGDVVRFDYPGIGGLARFYTKEVGVWQLLLIKNKEAFRIFEETN